MAEGRGLETIDQLTESNRVILQVACDLLCNYDQLYLHSTHITEAPLTDLSPTGVCSPFEKLDYVSIVVVHLSDHNSVMVAQVDYHIRAEQSINGKETTEYIHKVSMI